MKKRILRIAVILSVIAALTAACGQKEDERRTSFDKPPEMEIDTSKKYEATIATSKGDFTIELFAKEAPVTVNNFVFLARNRYFEGIVFHRIVPNFVIQTGDPTGTGTGGPGYMFKDELNSPYQYEPGIVAMANSGPDTNGSQFFVCTGEDSKLLNRIPNYTIFGRVKEGMDTVLSIGNTPVNGETPLETVTIEKVTISEK